MPEPHVTTAHAVWEAIKYPLVLIMGLFGWNLRRQVARVDKIEDKYVSQDEFNETLVSLRDAHKEQSKIISEGFRELRNDIRNVHSRIDNNLGKNHHE